MRGEAVRIVDSPGHVPIGLLSDAVIVNQVEPGQTLFFEDVELPDSLARAAWHAVEKQVLNNPLARID